MEMANTFPTALLNSRRHQSEYSVYQTVADSPMEGRAVYGAVPPGGCEVDLAIWLVGHVRIALEVKGGEYVEVDGLWQRTSDLGGETVNDQANQAFRAGIGLRNYLKQHEGDHSPFVVGALVLPNMPVGHVMERTNSQAIVLCGLERLVERLKAEAVTRNILFPPTWADARRESGLLLERPPEPEQEPAPEPEPPADAPNGAEAGGLGELLRDHGVYIGRVETLHLHLAKRKGQIPYPDWVPGV